MGSGYGDSIIADSTTKTASEAHRELVDAVEKWKQELSVEVDKQSKEQFD